MRLAITLIASALLLVCSFGTAWMLHNLSTNLEIEYIDPGRSTTVPAR